MLELMITAPFVRSLAKEMRHHFGEDTVSHTDAIEIVATALGWKPDALMHKLKSDAKRDVAAASKAVAERPVISLAPDVVQDDTIEEWRVLRYWQKIELAFVDLQQRRHDGSFRNSKQLPDWDLVAAVIAICRIAIGNNQGALDALEDVKSDLPRIQFVRAIALVEAGRRGKETHALIVEAFAKRPEMMRNVRLVRDPYIRDFSDRMIRVINGEFEVANEMEEGRLYQMPHMDAVAIAAKNGKCFVDNDLDKDISFLIEHLPQGDGLLEILKVGRLAGHDISRQIKESVRTDSIICLFDGEARKMMSRYVRATYDQTPEDYKKFWGLPSDYPMVAPGYAHEKRVVAVNAAASKFAQEAMATGETADQTGEGVVNLVDPKPQG
jgi:hypothetical protein